jgi:hypothetical protein
VRGGGGAPVEQFRLSQLLADLKSQLARRGARGIVGLQRKFRIMDDNGNQALSYGEFKKAIKECGLSVSDEVRVISRFLFASCNFLVTYMFCFFRI